MSGWTVEEGVSPTYRAKRRYEAIGIPNVKLHPVRSPCPNSSLGISLRRSQGCKRGRILLNTIRPIL